MKVVVTGGSGRVGSYVVRELAAAGHQVTVVDVRDVAVAFRKALELPSVEHEAVYVVADDSSCAEPLCELLPRGAPDIGRMALTGERPGISNARAKQLLGWAPKYSWRREESQDR